MRLASGAGLGPAAACRAPDHRGLASHPRSRLPLLVVLGRGNSFTAETLQAPATRIFRRHEAAPRDTRPAPAPPGLTRMAGPLWPPRRPAAPAGSALVRPAPAGSALVG